MHVITFIAITLGASVTVSSFPFISHASGVNDALLKRQQSNPNAPAGINNCPYNPIHVPAAPFNPKFPYNNAKNGLPGDGKGGYIVPDPDDTDHQFIAPNPETDIRGPCPALNTLANHGFIPRDGIATFEELLDAQQNVFNVGYDLATVLALFGLALTDGDPFTSKLSIGCDATNRTSFNPLVTGSEPGLDGHNKFEGDTSLTRNDYFTHGGENFKLNGTLFGMMTETTGGIYNLQNLALYRYQRYQQSIVENQNFAFGPVAILIFGAATFVYELMPSGTRDYVPDFDTISTFFGAQKNPDGTYSSKPERIPDNWTSRAQPYTVLDTALQIAQMYSLHPVLFGGNTGDGAFNAISFGDGAASIQNGELQSLDAADIVCLIYQVATTNVPSWVNGIVTPTVTALQFAASKLDPIFENFGCPLVVT